MCRHIVRRPVMNIFKRDPTKKLKKAYQQKLEAAMHAMRRGDVRENAMLEAQAQTIKAEIDKIEAL
ncbi:MAG: Lacal_2735 family protein [Gammaproteobacteria bacterium]|nr:Lacal_2735 family protein [Gammaproteobacteria bacterium]